MKQSNIILLLCSIMLGLSFITGCYLLQEQYNFTKPTVTHEKANENKPLMNIKETAEYLSLTELQVKSIITSEERILKQTGSFTGRMFPYIKINNEIFVSRDGLNEWIKESTTQRKEY